MIDALGLPGTIFAVAYGIGCATAAVWLICVLALALAAVKDWRWQR